MPMSLEAIKAIVEKLEGGSEVLDSIVGLIETEKQRGIAERKKANGEAQTLRKYKIALEKLGYDKEGPEDLDAYIDSLGEARSTSQAVEQSGFKPGELGEVSKQLAKLRKDFDASKLELSAEKAIATELRTKAAHATLRSRLTDALKDKVYGHDLLAENLISNNKVILEEDQVYFIDGDTRKEFDSGIQDILEKRTDILKNTQKGGAGSTPNKPTVNKKYNYEQLSNMSKEDIKANLADIRQSLGVVS